MQVNRLREVRESEGISRAALARSAGLVEKTVQRAEAGEPVSNVTRHKIVKALNRMPDKLRSYSVDDVFPTEPAVLPREAE